MPPVVSFLFPLALVVSSLSFSFPAFLLIAYIPGALLFRAPVLARERRAALSFEERAFWAIVLSLALSLAVTLLLAAIGQYRFSRLLIINGLVALTALATWRTGLLYRGAAARPGWHALLPVILIGLGLRLFFPPSEYVIGGRDPGSYMNEGIQIAQRGSLVIRDPVVAAVPPSSRDLFFPSHKNPSYYGLRFMGFWIMDPDSGATIGQFPHLFPASIALGYGLDGLTGARRAVGFWALLGLVAVYLAGARLIGPLAAAAGAVLLGVTEVQVWFARYPNVEVLIQAFLFAACLAAARAQIDEDPFFGPVAAVLLALLLFASVAAIPAVVAVVAAVVVARIDDRPIPRRFLPVLAIGLAAAFLYLAEVTTPYWARTAEYFRQLGPAGLLGFSLVGAGTVGVVMWATRRVAVADWLHALIPIGLVVLTIGAAAYAYLLRRPGGRMAEFDAYALRIFTSFYLLVPGLVAALLGYALVVRRMFWRDPALILTITAYALFLFYKTRIVPEHFWMARRFLPAVLPGALLFVAGAAFVGLTTKRRALQAVRLVIGVAFLVLLGHQYLSASRRLLPHVEYAGIIPKLEHLASLFQDDDLVLVESRNASDLHVLATPLAYIYARNVLVFNTPVPDKRQLLVFLTWARSRYREVFFLGSGGTDLLSKSIAVTPTESDRFQVPEYDSPLNAHPGGVTFKEFDYGVYRFVDPGSPSPWFSLDVGIRDDVHVVRFHAKEQEGTGARRTFRWTRDTSYVSIVNMQADHRLLTLWMHNGGRPPSVAPARVLVRLGGRLLGSVVVENGFRPYSFPIPAELAGELSRSDVPALLRLDTTVWNPRRTGVSNDDRELGVMVDRVEVR